jgi:cytochrome P450
MMGVANLNSAGGRDTVIHSVSGIIEYLARNSQTLEPLRDNPNRIVAASEEFFRVPPLSHIGPGRPVKTDVQGVTVRPTRAYR